MFVGAACLRYDRYLFSRPHASFLFFLGMTIDNMLLRLLSPPLEVVLVSAPAEFSFTFSAAMGLELDHPTNYTAPKTVQMVGAMDTLPVVMRRIVLH